jgi:hypothetical protein
MYANQLTSADDYLFGILARESVDSGPYSPVRSVQATLQPILSQWAGAALRSVTPSGSFAKGTANDSGTDIDLFISLATSTSLKNIYDGLFKTMRAYDAKKQNVSINVTVNGYDVDLVPARLLNDNGDDHSLYRHRADTWTKTNVQTHIALVQAANFIAESRILKLWRDQQQLDFPSFYLEMSTIQALYEQCQPASPYRFGSLSTNVVAVFDYLHRRITIARVEDPANSNNILSDDLSAAAKTRIQRAAKAALAAPYWEHIVR